MKGIVKAVTCNSPQAVNNPAVKSLQEGLSKTTNYADHDKSPGDVNGTSRSKRLLVI